MHRPIPHLLVPLLLSCCGPGVPPEDDAATDPAPDASTSSPTTSTSATPTTGDPPDDPDPTDATAATDDDDYLPCSLPPLRIEAPIPHVMLVLDKSGSMVTDIDRWDDDADDLDDDGFADADPDTPATPKVTRWHTLHASLAAFLGEFERALAFGAVLFPSVDAEPVYTAAACPVNPAPDVAPGPYAAAELLATLPPADALDLAGGTPTTAAIQTARAGLPLDEEAEHPRYILLVTDGAANCPVEPIDDAPESLFEVYDAQLPVVVAEALADGVPTWAIGLAVPDATSDATKDGNPDDTNNRSKLDEVAFAGGLADHATNVTNRQELAAALTEFAERVTTCSFAVTIPHTLVRIGELIVDPVGPSPLVYGHHEVLDCAAESGWRYTDDEKTAIELCGDACHGFRRSGSVELSLDIVNCE